MNIGVWVIIVLVVMIVVFLDLFKQKQIHGRIIFRIWSIDSDESWWIVDLIKYPIDFWKRVRWSRFFQIIR